jgi:hypothetical protein
MEKFIPFRLDGWVPHVPSDHHVINVEFFPDVAAPSRSSDTCLLFGVFGMYQKKKFVSSVYSLCVFDVAYYTSNLYKVHDTCSRIQLL